MLLAKYLQNKPLFYDKIDYERMPRAYESICKAFKIPKIIHIIGTNGKGSTGRFLALLLKGCGAKVGHYTSPHIFRFNERFWLDGKEASDELLEAAHERIYGLLDDEFKDSLSYFEYATLLMIALFVGCDEIVVEAGMGGEKDATNVFEKKLSIFTPIGLDHTKILGQTLEEIASTKMRAMSKMAILNDQMDQICSDIAKDIAKDKQNELKFAGEILTPMDTNIITEYVDKNSLPTYQISNLALAFSAAKTLGYLPNLPAMDKFDLKARLQKIAPNVSVDVGHNVLGARAIAREFSGKKVVLVYNAFDDKDIDGVLKELCHVITRIEILEYESSQRALATQRIVEFAHKSGLKISKFDGIKESENYLVFGSFLVVEEFLKGYFET